jgi:GT2 family glycosyltransferase
LLDKLHSVAENAMAAGAEKHPIAPEVAVVITCRNYESFVAEAIISVAQQTYQRLRCVVVDDDSTDGSRNAIERTLAELGDNRFSLLATADNVGQLKAFQLALSNTSSQFVAFLDADDFWFPKFLECHVRAHLNSIHSASISGSDALIVDENNSVLEGTFSALAKPRLSSEDFVGHELPTDACPDLDGNSVVVGAGRSLKVIYVPRRELRWHWVNTSAMVFRRDFIDIAIPPDGKPIERHADYFLAHLAHILSGSLILPDALGAYRMHRRNLFAKLPRVGGVQETGIEPPNAVRHTHECLVLHILHNWSLFEALVGAEALGHGLRRLLPWRELDRFAVAHKIRADIRRAVSRGVRFARARDKPAVARLAIKFLGL